jgi:hypothetical protein
MMIHMLFIFFTPQSVRKEVNPMQRGVQGTTTRPDQKPPMKEAPATPKVPILDGIDESRLTWRQHVPVLHKFEWWRLRADRFPYIQRRDELDDFLFRGLSCHPRLSEYPMCKPVIQEYFKCRDSQPILSLLNVCAPIKEQMTSCINEVFVKNHQKQGRGFREKREEMFERNRERKLDKMKEQAEELMVKRTKLED